MMAGLLSRQAVPKPATAFLFFLLSFFFLFFKEAAALAVF